MKSSKFSVRFLANINVQDRRTVLGRTVQTLLVSCGLTSIADLSSQLVKKIFRYKSPTESEQWQVDLASELFKVKNGALEVPGFSQSEISNLFTEACIV